MFPTLLQETRVKVVHPFLTPCFGKAADEKVFSPTPKKSAAAPQVSQSRAKSPSQSGPELQALIAKKNKAQKIRKVGFWGLLLATVGSVAGAFGSGLTTPSNEYRGYGYYYEPRQTQSPVGEEFNRVSQELQDQKTISGAIQLPEIRNTQVQSEDQQLSRALQGLWHKAIDNAPTTERNYLQGQMGQFFEESGRRYDRDLKLHPWHVKAFDQAVQEFKALNTTAINEKPQAEKKILKDLTQNLMGEKYSPQMVSFYQGLIDKAYEEEDASAEKFAEEKQAYAQNVENNKKIAAEIDAHGFKTLLFSIMGLAAGAGALGVGVSMSKHKRLFTDKEQDLREMVFLNQYYWLNGLPDTALSPLEKSLLGVESIETLEKASGHNAQAIRAFKKLDIAHINTKPEEELAILRTWADSAFSVNEANGWERVNRFMQCVENFYQNSAQTKQVVPWTRLFMTCNLVSRHIK